MTTYNRRKPHVAWSARSQLWRVTFPCCGVPPAAFHEWAGAVAYACRHTCSRYGAGPHA